jgi:hypothetical protein
MKRSPAIQLTLVTSLASMLVACHDNRPTRYCVDSNWNVADELDCQRKDPRYQWHYGGGHGFVPIGTRLQGGSSIAPSSGFTSPSEGSISRGGIGGAGEAAHAGGGGE